MSLTSFKSCRTTALRAAMAALVLAFHATSALAAPITFSFTGTVTTNFQYGQDHIVGQQVSGFITLDPTTFGPERTDRLTYSDADTTYWNASNCPGGDVLQSDPLQMSGRFTTDGRDFTVGGGDCYDTLSASVRRGFGGRSNLFQVVGISIGDDPGWEYRRMSIAVFDALGTNSKIFEDPAGGLSLEQAINWFAEGARAEFYVFDADSEVQRSGVLTSVSVKSQVPMQVPEPASLALVGCGLLGFLAGARRRPARTA